MIERWELRGNAGALHAVYAEAAAADDPDGPVLSQRFFGAWLAKGWAGDRDGEVWFASGRGGALGWYRLQLPEKENSARAYLDLTVKPAARRRGTGTALLEHARSRAAANGRSLLLGWALEGSPGEMFALSRGGTHDFTDVRRVQDLSRVGTAAAVVAPGYSLHAWTGPVPGDLVGQVAALRQAMQDAPHSEGAEAEVWDAGRVRALEKFSEAAGSREYSVAARHDASGTFVALTQVAVDAGHPEWGFQEMTVVIRGHRGRRLGLAVKREMLSVLGTAEPRLRRIITDNASANAYMIAVNEALGYERFEPSMKWYRLAVQSLCRSAAEPETSELAGVPSPLCGKSPMPPAGICSALATGRQALASRH